MLQERGSAFEGRLKFRDRLGEQIFEAELGIGAVVEDPYEACDGWEGR